jgi:vacuolar-type H+-ATPase subunit I/STV1
MKQLLFIAAIAIAIAGCDTKAKEQLHRQVDSLKSELHASQAAEATLEEVGVLLDSIDASRQAFRITVREGISYAGYIDRLKYINENIKTTQAKLATLEASAKAGNKKSVATIHRLQADLKSREAEIIDLQLEVVKMRDQNRKLFMGVAMRDSVISSRDEIIRLKESDISSLQGLVEDINEINRVKVSNLYYAQAEALEVAAQRTKFAPRKKKETKREALELYRLSLSMGNPNAQERITKLEKDLS